MKKKGIIALLLCLVMVLVFTGCGPKTLEDYVKKHKDVQEQVQTQAEASNLTVEFKGNDVIYTYDFADAGTVTEDIAKSPEMAAQLESALSGASGTFTGLCQQLEDETKISGIRIVVNYVFNDYTIVSKTYTSSGEA